jgi:hypothetical protein
MKNSPIKLVAVPLSVLLQVHPCEMRAGVPPLSIRPAPFRLQLTAPPSRPILKPNRFFRTGPLTKSSRLTKRSHPDFPRSLPSPLTQHGLTDILARFTAIRPHSRLTSPVTRRACRVQLYLDRLRQTMLLHIQEMILSAMEAFPLLGLPI